MRSVDGVASEGRFIEPEAYAYYVVAALREARGQWAEALAAYQQALDVDGDGPELRTRLGAVACKLGRNELADEYFAQAERKGSDYGPLWFELAQCRKSRGQLADAQSAALDAVRLDPERFETSLLAADIAEQRGDQVLAWQLRDALATHAPDSAPVWRRVAAAAAKTGDRARSQRAEARLLQLASRASTASHPPTGLTRALAALARADVTTARHEADKLLGADPGNGDALVMALAVADLEQDHATFDALLSAPRGSARPVSPEMQRLLGALLQRRVSAQAAQLLQPAP